MSTKQCAVCKARFTGSGTSADRGTGRHIHDILDAHQRDSHPGFIEFAALMSTRMGVSA